MGNRFFIGILIGLGIAGAIVVYFNFQAKSPTESLLSKSLDLQNEVNSKTLVLAPTAQIHTNSSAPLARESAGKYDFYDVLKGEKNINSKNTDAEVQADNVKSTKVAANKVVASSVAPTAKTKVVIDTPDDLLNTPKDVAVKSNVSYLIQAGVFSSSDAADKVVAQLALAGVSAKVKKMEKNSTGPILYKVIVANVSDKKEANNLIKKIKEAGFAATMTKSGK